jgi:hypothetical protein
MKNYILTYFYLFIPSIIFAPSAEPIRLERSKTKESRTARPEVKETIEQKKPLQKISAEVQESRLPHEIDPKTGLSDFERALKDGYKERSKNPAISREESLQKARELFEKARREDVKTSDFVLHLKERYNSLSLNEYYGMGKHDTHSQELMKDLATIDPYLAQKFVDSFVDVKQKSKTKSIVTSEDFITWLEQNPEYIINPSKFTGKANEKTPIEDAIELKDPKLIQEIMRIAKEKGISSDQLIQPLKDKFLDILQKNDGAQVTEYLRNINKIGVPELTHIIIRNTMRSELQRAIEGGDVENAKLALEIAKENRVDLTFLTKPLIEKYKNLTKTSHKYLQQIYDIGDDELSHFVYGQITANITPQ